MKIYIARQMKEFMPDSCRLKYPPNNTNKDYTIEQDFLNFLYRSEFLTADYDKASWVYIPVYWQRHCYNNNYYVGEVGLEKIQSYLFEITGFANRKCFTVCCIDNGPLGTPFRRDAMKGCYIFNGCMGDQEVDNDCILNVPLLTSEWKPRPKANKKYLASFVGRRNTHKTRDDMFEFLIS